MIRSADNLTVRSGLWLGLLFGLLFLVVMPPFQVADEPAHFYRAYQVATGQFLAERRGDASGGNLPASLVESVALLRSNGQFDPGTLARAAQLPLDEKRTIFVDFRNTALYAPLPYLPAAFAIAAGRLLELPAVALLYLGRLGALAACLSMLVPALWIAPGRRWLLLLVALAPGGTILRSSLSIDALANSLALLLVALALRHSRAGAGPLRAYDLIVLLAVAVALALSKQVYLLLPLIIVFLPAHVYPHAAARLAVGIVLLVACAGASLGWSALAAHGYVPVRVGEEALYSGVAPVSTPVPAGRGFDPPAQIAYMLAQPGEVGRLLLWTGMSQAPAYFVHAVSAFGWDARLPSVFAPLYGLMLLLAAYADSGGAVRIGWAARIGVAVIAGATLLAVLVVAYLLWNLVGAGTIHGVQGRYFAPLLPLLAFLLPVGRVQPRITWLPPLLVLSAALGLSYALVMVLERYW